MWIELEPLAIVKRFTINCLLDGAGERGLRIAKIVISELRILKTHTEGRLVQLQESINCVLLVLVL